MLNLITEDREFMMNYRQFSVYYGYKPLEYEHFMDRWNERFPGEDIKYFNRLLRKALDEIDRIYTFKPKTIKAYMCISKKSNIKFPVEIDTNGVKPGEKPKAIILTILDKVEQPYNKLGDIIVNLRESKGHQLVPDFEGAPFDFHHEVIDGRYTGKFFTDVEVDI